MLCTLVYFCEGVVPVIHFCILGLLGGTCTLRMSHVPGSPLF